MYEVQKFLRDGNTLEDLTTEYGIKANVCDVLGVVSLNYSMIDSDIKKNICRECRALILELDTWNVVSRSFYKFDNYQEPNAEEVRNAFDWDSLRVEEKIDGSLIQAYFYKNQWNFATRSVADAETPIGGYDMTFRELIDCALEEMNVNLELFDPNILYTFELTSPLNAIVVAYEGHKLTWLAAWNRDNLEELDINSLPDIGIPRVERHSFNTLSEITKYVDNLAPSEGEGVVISDKYHHRLKLKSAEYLKAFHVLTSVEATPRNKLSLLLSDKLDDVYGLLPVAKRAEMDQLKDKFDRLLSEVKANYALFETLDRKPFAQAVLEANYPYVPWLFLMKNGKSLSEILEKIEHPSPAFYSFEKIMDKYQ